MARSSVALGIGNSKPDGAVTRSHPESSRAAARATQRSSSDHYRHGMTAGIAARVAPEVSGILNDAAGLRQQEPPELTIGGC